MIFWGTSKAKPPTPPWSSSSPEDPTTPPRAPGRAARRRPDKTAEDADAAARSSSRSRRSQAPKRWYVQTGTSHRSLGTVELWLELASGKLTAASRVWLDEGQCWARIDQVEELACALVVTGPHEAGQPVEGRITPTERLAPETPPSSAVREARRLSVRWGADAPPARRKRTAV
jgi:hypothetical protein